MKGAHIEEISNPPEQTIKVQAKSMLLSRLPGSKGDDFKTAVIRLFEENNPHKKAIFPTKVYKFSNIEKVRMMRLNVSYYLEGSDIVVNDLEEVNIRHEGNKLFLKAYQFEVEKRVPGAD